MGRRHSHLPFGSGAARHVLPSGFFRVLPRLPRVHLDLVLTQRMEAWVSLVYFDFLCIISSISALYYGLSSSWVGFKFYLLTVVSYGES